MQMLHISVNSLTINKDTVGNVRVLSVSDLTFRWDLVLIYAGLRFLSGGGLGMVKGGGLRIIFKKIVY